MKSTQALIKSSIILILLIRLSACQQVRPAPIATAILVIPTASQSAYPSPNLTLGPTPLPYIPPQWPVVTPTPFPFPTATIPLPTPIIPLAATITQTPGDISVANLLPPHGNYLEGVVADIASGGKPAAVVLSDGPIGPVLYPNDLDQAELHLTVYPWLKIRSFCRSNPKSNIRMDAIDLNQDGQRELMLRPDWEGGLIFQSTGLSAWPRLLDANGDIPFTGGEFGVFEEKQRFPFNTLHPVLYYAGMKQATIGDMDGDGLYEVDLSYSDREGADTWQVIRYHWNHGQYEYSGEKFTRPAAEPILPAQSSEVVLSAFYPLPTLAMGGKGTPGPVLVTALQVSSLDLNRDGRNETLLVYGVTSPVKTFSIAGAGLAIYDAEDHLTWKSDFQRFPAGEVEASVRMVEA